MISNNWKVKYSMKTPISHRAWQQQTHVAAILTLLIYGFQAPWYAYLTQTQLSSYESRRFVRLVKQGRFLSDNHKDQLKHQIIGNTPLFSNINNLGVNQYKTTGINQYQDASFRNTINNARTNPERSRISMKIGVTSSRLLTKNEFIQLSHL